jgi:predicted aspartyl protease
LFFGAALCWQNQKEVGIMASPRVTDAGTSPAFQPFAGNQRQAKDSTMGRTVVTAKLENLDDLFSVEKGQLTADKVRRVEVTDALVDTGATGLLVPKRLIDQLGLFAYRTRDTRTIAGPASLPMYRAVRLTVQDRECIMDVVEISDEFSVVIGQVPLELMDWVVDPKGQRLVGNPAHGGEQMMEV